MRSLPRARIEPYEMAKAKDPWTFYPKSMPRRSLRYLHDENGGQREKKRPNAFFLSSGETRIFITKVKSKDNLS